MEKLYYSIGEVSKLAGVEPHVLRYWESVFSELSPSKNRAGNRIYTQRDIDVILELKVLIKDKEFSTAGARKALKQRKQMQKQSAGSKSKTGSDMPDMFSVPVDLKRDLKEIRLLMQEIHDKL
ncbi:MAG: MerR family transcriptional regulator [Balneolia bacterium]|nr:MerR family transcriptional regulator [Balneolia bacterium]